MKHVIFFLIFIIGGIVFGESHIADGGFKLFLQAENDLYAARDMPVQATLSYTGVHPVTVAKYMGRILIFPNAEFAFENPPGWILNKRSAKAQFDGMMSDEEVPKGFSEKTVIDLHDYFKYIPTGKTELKVTVTFSMKEGADDKILSVQGTLPVNIRRESRESLEKYIQGIRSQIITASDSQEKIMLYERLAHCQSPSVIQMLLEGVRDERLNYYRGDLMQKAYLFAKKFDQHELLVEFLLTAPEDAAPYFFRKWAEDKINLSDSAIKKIYGSSNKILCEYADKYIRK